MASAGYDNMASTATKTRVGDYWGIDKENSQYIFGIKASASDIGTRGEDTRPQAMDPVQGRVKF